MSQVEPVPASEADAPAGMTGEPHRNPQEGMFRSSLVTVAKDALSALIGAMTDDNAPRTLAQLSTFSGHFRRALAPFNTLILPEELEEGTYRARGGNPGAGMDRETAAVHGIQMLVTQYNRGRRFTNVHECLSSADAFERRIVEAQQRVDVLRGASSEAAYPDELADLQVSIARWRRNADRCVEQANDILDGLTEAGVDVPETTKALTAVLSGGGTPDQAEQSAPPEGGDWEEA